MKKIAILGFGVVGCGVAEVIAMNHDKIAKRLGEELEVKKILDIRDFPDSPFASLVTHEKDEVLKILRSQSLLKRSAAPVSHMSIPSWLFRKERQLLHRIRNLFPHMVSSS